MDWGDVIQADTAPACCEVLYLSSVLGFSKRTMQEYGAPVLFSAQSGVVNVAIDDGG